MDTSIINFLRTDLLSKLKGLVRLVVSLGAVNIDVQADRLLTPPEAKIRDFLNTLPVKLSEADAATVVDEIRKGSDHYGNAVALIAKAQVD